MSQIVITTDSALAGEELPLPNTKPFGIFVPHLQDKPFAIISSGRGRVGYFTGSEDAQPFLRMMARAAHRGRGRFDFRLYRWTDLGWEVFQHAIALDDSTLPAPVPVQTFEPSEVST